MRHRRSWHNRPVLSPLLYGASFFIVGSMTYTAGYLATNRIRDGIYFALFMYVALVLYFLESSRVAKKGKK